MGLRKSKREIKVYFCPKCKSFDVKYIFGLGNIFGIIPKQRCNNCKLEIHGNFPVLVVDKEVLERKNKKKITIKKNWRKKNESR